MTTAGIILAGGQARRMGGGDKALLAISGRPLLGHVIDRLAPQVAEIALNANGDPARFGAYDLPVIPDTVPGFAGPLAGVLAGMRWAAGRGHSHIASAAADTPFFPADLVSRLNAAKGHQPIAMAATEDPQRGLSDHPTFTLWPVDLADDLERALTVEDLRKVIVWTDRHGCARAVFPGGHRPFFNINTPQDLADAEAMAREMDQAEIHLAVYGTLAPGQVNHHELASLTGHWISGTVRGRLIEDGWGAAHGCPGIVLDPSGSDITVHVFRSTDLPGFWSRLDAFEGPGYRRVPVSVHTGADPITASIYELAR